MKKIILSSISILIITFVTLSILGERSEYVAEKLLYGALKEYKKVIANPEVAPPGLLSSVQSKLKRVITKFPESKAAKAAYVKLVEVCLIDKKYELEKNAKKW